MESGSHPKIAPAPVLAGPPSWGSQLYPPRAETIVAQELACRDLCPQSIGNQGCPSIAVWVTDTRETDSLGLSVAGVLSPRSFAGLAACLYSLLVPCSEGTKVGLQRAGKCGSRAMCLLASSYKYIYRNIEC